MTIHASIHGRAARDGELRVFQAGKSWCRVSVACEAGQNRETGEALTQWVTLIAFGRVAEDLAKVEKGQTISAIGRLELSRWTTQDGEQRESLQLIAEAVVTARSARPNGRKPKGNGDRGDYSVSHRAQSPADVPFDDDLPF
jgi:single-strand DNA-binding protein